MAERSYNYPAHNAVRHAWMRFLPEDLSEPDEYGLYLPATENLELEGYLAKGMNPSRLTGAEHDQELIHPVRANARGVKVVSGSIADAVCEHVAQGLPLMRFANLDFDGNQHTFTEELLAVARVLPSRKTSYLGITSFAARDQMALKQGTINTCKFFSALPDIARFMEGYGKMMRRYEHLVSLIPNGESNALAHFQRELGLLWWIVLMFGCVDETQTYHHVDSTFVDVVSEPLRVLKENVEQQIAQMKNETDMVFVFEQALRQLLARRKVHVWIDHIERYAFWSINRQPMRTWYFRIRPIPAGETTMQDLLAQVWDLSASNPLIYIDRSGMEVRIG